MSKTEDFHLNSSLCYTNGHLLWLRQRPPFSETKMGKTGGDTGTAPTGGVAGYVKKSIGNYTA